jgi:hypothetical protein
MSWSRRGACASRALLALVWRCAASRRERLGHPTDGGKAPGLDAAAWTTILQPIVMASSAVVLGDCYEEPPAKQRE